MRICIYGAGAIGGLLGAKLAVTGEDVTLIARGPHLAAIRERGLTVASKAETLTVRPRATDKPEEAGRQDFVIVALKSNAVPGIVGQMLPLLGQDTAVVMAVNGVPWWYFYGVEGPFRDRRIKSLDPENRLWTMIGPQRTIGCVVYPAAEIVAPGHIQHIEGDRFSLGEPDGQKSERVLALSRALTAAGLKAPVKADIRSEIWVKLWGNAVFNPISALTGATLRAICENHGTAQLVRTVMREVELVANALGIAMPVSLERRMAGAAAIGDHKTSMLQDIEKGRPPELDAIIAAVIELAEITKVSVPQLQELYALTCLRAETSLSDARGLHMH
jgi:2-dehydropantoate 2-reductase